MKTRPRSAEMIAGPGQGKAVARDAQAETAGACRAPKLCENGPNRGLKIRNICESNQVGAAGVTNFAEWGKASN